MAGPSVSYPHLVPFEEPMATFDFNTFLVGAKDMGLPVTVLCRLRDLGWKCKIDDSEEESFTRGDYFSVLLGRRAITLSRSQCFPLVGGGHINTIMFVSTLYHEFTHAYLIEFKDSLQNLIESAKLHYVGANRADGAEWPT
jgi:hypothetical protein